MCALVLATLLSPIERAFGGLDRVAVWHRRVATAAVVLLVPHVALITTSADRYETTLGHGLGDLALLGLVFLTVWALAPSLRVARWPGPVRRLARRPTNDGSPPIVLRDCSSRWRSSTVRSWIRCFTDRRFCEGSTSRSEFSALPRMPTASSSSRFVVPIYDYTVSAVTRLNETTMDVSLEPVSRPIAFNAGQFVFLAIGGAGGWQRHPFTVASAPTERRLDVSVKAVGDYTRDLYQQLRAGTPARVAGPFGGFDYRKGGPSQIWIAGGIGITPFSAGSAISTIRSAAKSISTTRLPTTPTPSSSRSSPQPPPPTRRFAFTS